MKARRPIQILCAVGIAGLAALATPAVGEPGAELARAHYYITPDGAFHATTDPASVPAEAAPVQPPRHAGVSGELCDTIRRLDDRGLGYWARTGVLRVEVDGPVRACLDRSSPAIAQAMAHHCATLGTQGYQVWSDLVSRALRHCEG